MFKKIQIGIIGLGTITQKNIKALKILSEKYEIKATTDLNIKNKIEDIKF